MSANSVDPDQMPHSVASDLGLQFAQACLSKILGVNIVHDMGGFPAVGFI